MATGTEIAPPRAGPARFQLNAPLFQRKDLALGILLIVLAAATAAVHWPVLSAQAIYLDDSFYVLENPAVRNPSFDSVGRFFSEVLEPSTVKGYYQPLTMMSLMMDAALSDGASIIAQVHRTNLAMHVVNVCLIALLLYRLFGEIVPAILAAALYAMHPLTVESVAWLSERKTLLATLFALSSLILYVEFARRKHAGWLISAAVAYGLALLSKPSAVPVPLLMLLLDFWPLRRLDRQSVIEKAPLFVLAAASIVVTLVSQSRTAGIGPQGEQVVPTTLLIVCHNIVFYLYKMVWPTRLSPLYPFLTPFDFSDRMLLAGVIGTAILILLLAVSLKWTRALATGWLFFFIALAPTLHVISFTFVIAADNYVYLPALGILLILCWLLTALWRASVKGGGLAPRIAVVAAVLLAAFAEASATRKYLLVWQDGPMLRRHVLELAPKCGRAYDLVASDLVYQGKTDDALELQLVAVTLDPNLYTAHQNLAATLLQKGRTDEAVEHLRKAIDLKPDYAPPYVNLGKALIDQGKSIEGLSLLEKAVKLSPTLAEAHLQLATIYAQQQRVNDALLHFAYAIQFKPNFPQAHNNLGILLVNLAATEQSPARLQKAADNFVQAVRLSPNYLSAHNNLARVLEKQGRRDEALYEYQEVLRLDAKNDEALKAVRILPERFSAVPRKPQ